AEGLYREATARFVELANAFLARLRGSEEPALGRLPGELAPETSFRAKRHFYFTEMLPITGAGAGAWLAAALGPRRAARAIARRDGQAYLERLLETNSARVSNDLADRVAESRRRLETEIVSLLRDLSASAERALGLGRERHRSGADAVSAELARLRSFRARVEKLAPWP
ncbi:MAG: hypothetical protein HY359_04950, partial [Candidatus Rokubacteria bacterium]|nr:hypothetical protein [Candidatus Rokubacteria bacterium]